MALDIAVSFLLENLGKLLVDRVILISGLDSELTQLKNDLLVMKAIIDDSTKYRAEQGAWRTLERECREIVYSAEDIIDAYLTQTAAAENSVIFRNLNRMSMAFNLSKRLRAFRKERLRIFIDHANRRMVDFGSSSTTAQHQTIRHRQDAQVPLLREDNNIVGFEDECKLIIGYLLEESEDFDIISIVGMPGLGKTTLAGMLYRDPLIQFQFPTLIWVPVSEDVNKKTVFLTILKKFTLEDMSRLNDSLLADIVRKYLERGKFALFFDGVLTLEDWRLIKVALPKSNRLGKVIITTQNQQVASEANPKRNPHSLRLLTSAESWELLQLEVFGNHDTCPSNLEELGKQIAMECGGVPLAIVVTGGILREKLSTSKVAYEWEKVLSSLSTYLHNDKEKRMESIISLSYNKLPHELRDCFLYLGMFPKDTLIPTWRLVRLWIAEGFIQPSLRKSLEEVAEDNLKELTDRNLVMIEEAKAGGGIKTCRLSNMMHEFCTTQAAFDGINLFQEVKGSGDGVFLPPIAEIHEYRRLCIHFDVENFIRQKPKGPIVRSFLSFSEESKILQPKYISAITEAFDVLRVFDVNSIKFHAFPDKILRLIHLRYIALSGQYIKALPDAIVKLRNLQTIRIDTMSRTLEIKADIWKVISLRHLKTKAAIVMKTEGKGEGGENLQTLSRLSTKSFSEGICKRALNLKNLGIRGNLDTLLNTSSMARLERLQKLKLLHDVYPNGTPLIRLPSREAFPPNLRILELSTTFLEWKHMDTLGMLLTLEILKLKQNAFMGSLWEVSDSLFPSLEVLLIKHTDLRVWTASEDSFPRLKCLVLKNCENLREIPHVLAKSLQALDIEQVRASAVESARRIKMENRSYRCKINQELKGDNLSSGSCPEFDWMPKYSYHDGDEESKNSSEIMLDNVGSSKYNSICMS